jgi:hypothetical protein
MAALYRERRTNTFVRIFSDLHVASCTLSNALSACGQLVWTAATPVAALAPHSSEIGN